MDAKRVAERIRRARPEQIRVNGEEFTEGSGALAVFLEPGDTVTYRLSSGTWKKVMVAEDVPRGTPPAGPTEPSFVAWALQRLESERAVAESLREKNHELELKLLEYRLAESTLWTPEVVTALLQGVQKTVTDCLGSKVSE